MSTGGMTVRKLSLNDYSSKTLSLVVPLVHLMRTPMDYQTFRKLMEKPAGKTSSLPPLDGHFPLDFAPDLSSLDDYPSFEDLKDGIEIENWAEDFSNVFPGFEVLACVDMELVEDFDSYAEFLIVVDTNAVEAAVYWFSAESWDWDEWESEKNGFRLMSTSFTEFFASLTAVD
jgi:hypothetical protein